MTLKNADVTVVIETLTDDFRSMLEKLNLESQQTRNHNIEPTAVIDQLLYNPNNTFNTPLTIDQLNSNYRVIMNLTGKEELVEKNTEQQNNPIIMQSAIIHLTAIASGFKAYADSEQVKQQQKGHSRAPTPQVVHIHHHRGYRRDYFMDYLWYQTLFGRDRYSSSYPSYPANPSTGKHKKDDNEVSTAGILLAVALVGAATATLGYSVMQTYYRIDEILHNEDKIANIGKLTVTAFAAWQGYLVGTLIGATYFANPLLGAVCSTIIASAAGMKLAKWSTEQAHNATNSDSALATDPRFCLKDSQFEKLISKGFDADVINEALREIAITIKAKPPADSKLWNNGLKFWHNPHGPLITLMRELKSGYKHERLVLNGKTFELMAPYYNVSTTNNTQPTYELSPSFGNDQPPAYEYYYQPKLDAVPQTGAGYPEWNHQTYVPEDYQSIYPEASAPPM